MPSLTAAIGVYGPVVDLAVLVSGPRRRALEQVGKQVPTPFLIQALIDTGAACTCVDPAVIGKLGLTPTGTVQIRTPSTGAGTHACNQYDLAFAVMMHDDFKIIDTIPVIEAHLAQQGHLALIGRDILSQGIMIYNGPANSVTISF